MSTTIPQSAAVLDDSASTDVVGIMLDQLCELLPEFKSDQPGRARIEAALRKEFGGREVYVATKGYDSVRREVLRRFNGRNATTLARELGIGRTTVYRWLKQPGYSK